LFAYWLGPDWGVFVNGRRVANETLAREERLRFLVAAVGIDVLPRSAIVLIVAVGFTLGQRGGYIDMPSWVLVLVWLIAAAWLALVLLTGYVLKPGALKTRLDGLHLGLRHGLTAIFVLLGGYSLLLGEPVTSAWLAAKLILLALLLTGGTALRIIVRGWVQELTGQPGSEGHIARTYPFTRKLVYLFWGTTIAIAFLGVTKPF
jgi:hypothetical protein